MKVGDLVTLSSYGGKSSGLSRWHGCKLLGLVVRTEDNPRIQAWTSKNESTYYYVHWASKDGPASRWGSASYYRNNCYFLRNDLKFVSKA